MNIASDLNYREEDEQVAGRSLGANMVTKKAFWGSKVLPLGLSRSVYTIEETRERCVTAMQLEWLRTVTLV